MKDFDRVDFLESVIVSWKRQKYISMNKTCDGPSISAVFRDNVDKISTHII